MRLSGDLGNRAEALQGSSGALGSTPASHSSRGSGGPGPMNSTVSSLKPLNMYTLGLQGLSSASARLRPLLALSSKSSQGQKRRLDLSRHTASQMLDAIPDEFGLQVLLEETGELFQVPNCRCDMTVGELKAQLDLVAGIPFNLQRLQYLDQGILMDESTLKFHDVAPGGVMSLCIWQYDNWTELVLAAVEGDPSKLSCLGVSSQEMIVQTAYMQHRGEKEWKLWVEQRAFVALYITSHRGHVQAVKYLLEHGSTVAGANCLGKTPLGRTPLHVASAMGRMSCVMVLLRYGASVSEKDQLGETPMTIAHRLHCYNIERRMFLFYWMAKNRSKGSKETTVSTKLSQSPFLRGQPSLRPTGLQGTRNEGLHK